MENKQPRANFLQSLSNLYASLTVDDRIAHIAKQTETTQAINIDEHRQWTEKAPRVDSGAERHRKLQRDYSDWGRGDTYRRAG